MNTESGIPLEKSYRFDARILRPLHHVHWDKMMHYHELACHRRTWLRWVQTKAEDGKIAIVQCGRDCDGVEYDDDVTLVDANIKAVDEHIAHQQAHADGPCYFTLMKPSAAAKISRTSRDLVLEAFENGRQHCIHPSI